MILVRNRLKKLKKTIEDEDMLNYLKYSHLDMSHKNMNKSFGEATQLPRVLSDKSTQFPETQNKSTQTRDTADKGVDTYDDFEKIVPPYVSLMHSEDFDRNEKMIQVWTRMFNENLPPSPPSSSSGDNDEGLTRKSIKMGFRLAGYALQTAMTGATTAINVGDVISDLISAPHQSSEEEQVNNPEVISVHSSPPQTINSSSSSNVEEVPIEISSSSSSR